MTGDVPPLAASLARLMADLMAQPMRTGVRVIHPASYAYRQRCPMWTNKPSAGHVHDRRCQDYP